MNPWARLAIPSTLIVLFVFLAYLPALRGGFVWDDDSYITENLTLRSSGGLAQIWFQPDATPQYYPLVYTSFWLDYQLWKFWTTPYHVENVLLHALAALLFWRLLRQLEVPGAWLAGALFALHPVMVESVAWITERKNVLSLVLYLGALLAYGRYAPWRTRTEAIAPAPDSSRSPWPPSLFYGLAFVLFLGALLAKTTTFSLPAALLLIGWWQRGQIRWGADVLPTLPFFALALGLCAVTAWLEKYHVGAQGPDFALTFPQRGLIAGRVFWFLPGPPVLAGEPLLCLPALAARPRGVVAMALSGDGPRHPFHALAGPGAPGAWAGDRPVLLCGHPVSGAGVSERVCHALFICVGPLGLSVGAGDPRAGGGTGGAGG